MAVLLLRAVRLLGGPEAVVLEDSFLKTGSKLPQIVEVKLGVILNDAHLLEISENLIPSDGEVEEGFPALFEVVEGSHSLKAARLLGLVEVRSETH